MPPHQCPGCGRFLRNALVDALGEGARPCPGCGEELTSTRSGGDVSVRPPDLPLDSVGATGDVLAGWDVGADDDEVASWQLDRRPAPIDATIVLGAGTVGLLLGATFGAPRRGRTALLAAGTSMLIAAASRRVWRLEP